MFICIYINTWSANWTHQFLKIYIGYVLVSEKSSRRPWWSGSVFMVSLQPISATSVYHLRSSASVICSDWHSTGSTRLDCNWTMKFRSQRTSHHHMEPSATSTTVTGPVAERLQADTEDAPVLDRLAPLRHLHDSGADCKYPDLLTYLHIGDTISNLSN